MFDPTYLAPAARKFGDLWTNIDFDNFIATATPEDLHELAQVHDEVERREDVVSISKWIRQCWRDRDTNPTDWELGNQVGQLFLLFRKLADAGAEPFTSRIELPEEPKKANWDIVPGDIAYLTSFGEWYLQRSREWGDWDIFPSITPDDKARLSILAARVLEEAALPRIYAWINNQSDGCVEAWTLYSLFKLLDELELRFD
jgi:hypothetical protein